MEKIVYDYPASSKNVELAIKDALNYVYSISYPKPEKSFDEMCHELNEERKQVGGDRNWRKTYGKYQWPIDFFYIPANVLKTLWDGYKSSYGIEAHWDGDMEALINFLFKEPGFRDVYVKSEKDGTTHREAVKQPLLKDVIGEENAEEVRILLKDYKETYKWGLSEVNSMAWAFLSTPTSNKATVVKAWKETFDKDIELPNDEMWIDCYDVCEDAEDLD